MNEQIKWHGNYIKCGHGVTAVVKYPAGSLPEITIRKHGKVVKVARGSSLYFSCPLTDEDRQWLDTLCEGENRPQEE